MRRTTVLLPDDLSRLLERERRRRDVSAATVIREALSAYLEPTVEPPKPLPFIGIGASGKRGVARNAEQILRREWGGDDLAGSRRR